MIEAAARPLLSNGINVASIDCEAKLSSGKSVTQRCELGSAVSVTSPLPQPATDNAVTRPPFFF